MRIEHTRPAARIPVDCFAQVLTIISGDLVRKAAAAQSAAFHVANDARALRLQIQAENRRTNFGETA